MLHVHQPDGALTLIQSHPSNDRNFPLGWSRSDVDRLDPFAEFEAGGESEKRSRFAAIGGFVAAVGLSLIASALADWVTSQR